ncbi:MAG: adenylate/guanylate cyclase domain-containing protein [Roseiarcus sp.]
MTAGPSPGAAFDVGTWLNALGLQQYEAAFHENAIDGAVLPTLTADDLREMGVAAIGHRRRLMNAIAELAGAAADAAAGAGPDSGLTASPQRVPASAERRHLTVMFCDLAGSTALSARLDPEDMGEVIRVYQDACSGVVTRYDGFVAKFMGDGILVYFGFPRAHEDDAERAVRAGLEIAALAPRLETRADEPLAVRIGVATGRVVVGDLIGQGSAQEQPVVGETPNLAARLQALAEPGGLLIADSTRRLLGAAFELKDLGQQDLRGFAAPTRVFAVLREDEDVNRFEAASAQRMTPFVGREPEVALLVERWRDARAGEGKVALLSGEAGIGKSRILAVLRERVGDERHIPVRYQCSPHHLNDAFYPIVVQIRRAAGLAGAPSPEARLDRIEAMAARSGLNPKEAAPLIASLCTIPFEGRYPPLDMAPAEQKERSIAVLIGLYQGLTREAPVLAILEDAHWIDPTSLEVFTRLIELAPRLHTLIVVSFRPDFAPQWIGRAHVELLSLGRLGRRHAVALIDRVAAGKALPDKVLDQIVAKTDGVPLFIEELTKTVLESGLLCEEGGAYVLASRLTPLAIPSTLEDSLMARLDRLASVKEVAQIGAAIGREFSLRLLESVAPIKGAALAEALRRLEAAGLVFTRGAPSEATYVFKHALVQDVAYQSLLKSRRQVLHQRIAEILCNQFPDRADDEPSLVAHHFTQAGMPDAAIEWWDRAGSRAMRRFANAEAVVSFGNALDLVPDLPPGGARDERELALRLAVGPALLAARGYASTEVERNYREAETLADRLGDREAVFTSARGLWHYFYDRGELAQALTLAQRLIAIGELDGSAERMSLAMRAFGSTLMNKGDFPGALGAFDRCLTEGGRATRGSSLARHGEEPQVVALQYKGLVLALKGLLDSGLSTAREAMAQAEALNFPLIVPFASTIVGLVLFLRRDFVACAALSSRQLEFCAEHGFVFWSAAHQILRGAARAYLDADPDGLAEAEAGIRNWGRTGAALHVPTWSSLLADAALAVGDLEAAEKALSNKREQAERRGEYFAMAELLRLEGRIDAQRGRADQARQAFAEAVAVARRQGAGFYLLRASRDLAQLMAKTGDAIGAHDVLAPVIAAVVEHRDGADFKEASALLSALESDPNAPS